MNADYKGWGSGLSLKFELTETPLLLTSMIGCLCLELSGSKETYDEAIDTNITTAKICKMCIIPTTEHHIIEHATSQNQIHIRSNNCKNSISNPVTDL